MEQPRKKLHHYNSKGHAHELTFSCHRRRDLFLDDVACEIFLEDLEKSRTIYNFRIWAYVIMPNLVHLLIWPEESNYDIATIERGTKGIMSKRYAKNLLQANSALHDSLCINSHGKKAFRFWQPGGGFYRNLWNAMAIHDSIGYIEANPVRKKLASFPEEWQWSSAYARKRGQGLMPDKFQIPVLMGNPQRQRVGAI